MNYLLDFKRWTRLNEESCAIGNIPASIEGIKINGVLGKQDCSDWKWKSSEDPFLVVGYLANSGNGAPGIICTINLFITNGANTVGENLNEYSDINEISVFKEISIIMGYASPDGIVKKQVGSQKYSSSKVFEWRATGDESSLIAMLNSLSEIEWPWTPAG
jgi:hypothetical protein